MKPAYTLLLFFLGVTLISACKKNESDNVTTNNTALPTVKELLVAGKWQMSANTATATINGKDTTMDQYAQMNLCAKDNFMTFADKNVTNDENTNKCPGEKQTSTFAWTFIGDNTRLAIYDANPDTFNVEVSTTQLKLTEVTKNSSGNPLTIFYTFKNIK